MSPYRPPRRQTRREAADAAMRRVQQCSKVWMQGIVSDSNLELALKSAVKLNGYERVCYETGLDKDLVRSLTQR